MSTDPGPARRVIRGPGDRSVVLSLWDSVLDDPAHQVVVSLQPGDLVVFHNHRILHGRTGFALGASGRRELVGCYLEIDELHNRRRLSCTNRR